jgi:glycerol-3-phosphate dehydrogenase (NAD(P)+)
MNHQISIFGAGAWGQALARAIRQGGVEVLLWNRTPKPGATSDLHEALSFSRYAILAVSAQHVRAFVTDLLPFSPEVCFLASKGIEKETGLLLSEMISDLLPSCALGVIGGPNLASEVGQEFACGLTVAVSTKEVETLARSFFSSSSFILEVSSDVIGVQIAGAMKNVMAIGYGFLQQTCSSENLWASYLLLALKEIGRLIKSLGGQTETILSFAGLGDLILTSHSPKGRNSQFGRLWPHYEGGLVEGVATTSAVLKRAYEIGIELPLTQGINAILQKEMDVSCWPSYLQKITQMEGVS